MRFSGFDQFNVVQTGGDLANPALTIEGDNILGDSSFEVSENEDQTDVNGESPHSGQFADVTIQSDDHAARQQLVAFRTASPEQKIDIQGVFPDGSSITVRDVRAKTMIQPVIGEKGQVNGWALESRGFTTDVVDFD